MTKKIRVRFAPSPTGPLHIGGLRTALFNYLFAKKHGGDFLLRIEDTDQNRYVEGAEQYIIDALNWCGIPFDEGVGKEGKHAPYRQSERKEIYATYAQQLISSGWAYYAFDTPEQLENQRKNAEEKGETFIYNWKNREQLNNSLSIPEQETLKKIQQGEPYVVRFKMPKEILTMTDIIRGEVVIDTQILDDKVLFKSDGMPTYHLANIVDDHLMEITHVIRGEEWLPSLPLHILLYRAFGWEAPEFAHLPLILKPTGSGKLSKRDGDKFGFPVFPLEWTDPESGAVSRGYREDGYLPEALINFLALLGWNSSDEQEVFSKEELINSFELERVHKAGARFNLDKIKWFNHHYIQNLSDDILAENLIQIAHNKGFTTPKNTAILIVKQVKERANLLTDLWDLSHYFFTSPTLYDSKAVKKHWKENSEKILKRVSQLITSMENCSAENIEIGFKQLHDSENIGAGQLMPLLRLALVGELKGANISQIIQIIGRQETIERIEKFINFEK